MIKVIRMPPQEILILINNAEQYLPTNTGNLQPFETEMIQKPGHSPIF